MSVHSVSWTADSVSMQLASLNISSNTFADSHWSLKKHWATSWANSDWVAKTLANERMLIPLQRHLHKAPNGKWTSLLYGGAIWASSTKAPLLLGSASLKASSILILVSPRRQQITFKLSSRDQQSVHLFLFWLANLLISKINAFLCLSNQILLRNLFLELRSHTNYEWLLGIGKIDRNLHNYLIWFFP